MNDLLSTTEDVEAYLRRHEQKEILRFVAVGSVDDGKSTLIGRLLHDTNGVYEDQLRAVKRASQMGGTEIDFSLFTDGLKAEREQGITIDVAYRYFTTARRKFIIADTPGHVQYTRNMATGASTANVAVILIDARLGVLTQSRRHAYIAALLGIPHLVVGVNKMDLRDFDEGAFSAIEKDFGAFARQLGFRDVTFIPISALRGDNVVHKSERMRWYRGPTVLELLDTVPITQDRNLSDFRFPVQTVLRPNLDYRGYAGQIASGTVRPGDPILVLPSRKTTKVTSIDTFEGSKAEAFAPMSVTLRLADEIDISRGDLLVAPDNVPRVVQRFEAMVVWLHERPLDPHKSYLLKHTTKWTRAEVDSIDHGIDLETLAKVSVPGIGLNDIAKVTLRTHKPLFVDAYTKNRATGAFILVDSLTNDTVAAGMILEAGASADRGEGGALGTRTQVSPAERRERLGHEGRVVRVEGNTPDAARSVAFATERLLFDRGVLATVVEDASDAPAKACAAAGVVALWVAPGKDSSREGDAASSAPPGDDVEARAAALVQTLNDEGLFGR